MLPIPASPRLAAALLAALLLAGGCRSAKGVYTDAMAFETAGRHEDAARAYADALRRDPDLPNAAGRLGISGSVAVRQRLAEADAAPTRVAAADALLAAEALIGDAAGVGVRVARPASFETFVGEACADAVTELLGEGRAEADRGDFASALARYDRARRYRPTPAWQDDLDASARDAYAGWATADISAGRFRAALGHADAALGLAPPGSPLADDLAVLRADAVAAGTLLAAVFPATTPRTPTGDALPQGFLQDVSDILLDERLAEPPLFVALVDPAEARRALRWSRADLAGDPRALADLTRSLDADVGLVAEVDGFEVTESETERRDVTFRLRMGGPAPGVRTTTRMELRAQASLVAVDAAGRRVACTAGRPVEVSRTYDAAESASDTEALRLSSDERDLFGGRSRDRAYDALADDLAERLAGSLAERVAACVGALVP